MLAFIEQKFSKIAIPKSLSLNGLIIGWQVVCIDSEASSVANSITHAEL